MEECIFCKIVKGEVEGDILFESEELIVVPDINPAAETHLLIIPKVHLSSFQDIDQSEGLVSAIVEVAKRLINERGITSAYKLVINGGSYQQVPHLHLHLLGGKIFGGGV